ncbi:MAG: hypothetical protein P4L00_10730 [Candidatus Acidoferrales bacterium]|nr:hypothetical protein [Candidatus Acidoferrales bacterium]
MSDYQREWQKVKQHRNQFWLMAAGYVPVCFTVAWVSMKLFQTSTPAIAFAIFWMGLIFLTGIRVNTFLCPRCGKWFSTIWWYNLSFFARRCVHCGLPKYQS